MASSGGMTWLCPCCLYTGGNLMYLIGVILGILLIAIPIVFAILIAATVIKLAVAFFGAGTVVAIIGIVITLLLVIALIGAMQDN